MKTRHHAIPRRAVAVLAVLMVLATATALAVGLSYSRQVEVKRIAREAVMQTYGLDGETIALFAEHAEEKNGAWTVTYRTELRHPMGEYTVTVQPDGSAKAVWSLEGETDAWGQAEIAAYIREKNGIVLEQMQAEASAGAATAEPRPTPAPVPGATLTHEQARAAADEALKNAYGFDDDGLKEFDAEMDFAGGVWQVHYSAGGWHWKDGYLKDKAGTYLAEIEDASGKVLRTQWSLEGVDPNSYTRETFGKAQAYNAQCMTWVHEIRTQFEAAYTAVEASRWPVSVEEMARLDSLMIGAGFDPQKYNHVLPGEKDLSLEEALHLAAQALENNYGVKREVMDESSFAYTDLTQEATHRQWYFWIQNHELQMGWQITLDAQTGEILDLLQESFAGGNG